MRLATGSGRKIGVCNAARASTVVVPVGSEVHSDGHHGVFWRKCVCSYDNIKVGGVEVAERAKETGQPYRQYARLKRYVVLAGCVVAQHSTTVVVSAAAS